MKQITFNQITSGIYNRRGNGSQIVEQIKLFIEECGGFEYLDCDYTKSTIVIRRKKNRTYDNRKDTIKTYRAGKDQLITEFDINFWVNTEIELLQSKQYSLDAISKIKSQLTQIIEDYPSVSIKNVSETKIELSIVYSHLRIYRDYSGSVIHTPHISSFGFETAQIMKIANECQANANTLNDVKTEIFDSLTGFFKQKEI